MTVAGAAWLLSYKSTGAPSVLGSVPPASPDTSTAQPGPTSSPGPVTTTRSPSGTFTGLDVPNRYGDVQVEVVVSNGRITDVRPIQLPRDRARSAYISQVAAPLLRTEALQAQSARIDIISGATYTSDSYAQSMESALQQAHLG